ncbi:PREDICTED: probable C-mannosyltransferase DPY19L1 isoform X2 [Priapulus caudatus]|uniref:Probable C-mannosyltransferase DPY19L1 isoform X2 n=1 Tax=Priapulus caudatus TaxID=37621 RepID=A0ABM1ERR1_PRICU|nr:PREDICTED: probable C-mannosyltransferase DPY19L1 isoform X2 [Priapulus caudatus]
MVAFYRWRGKPRQRPASATMAGKKRKTSQVLQEKHGINGNGATQKAGHRTGKHNKVDAGQDSSVDSWYIVLALAIAVTISYVHGSHIAYMFESDKHFSHMSTLEREMSFRTEMGLYYSYFKTMTEAPTFLAGLSMLVYDNVTEFPLTINTLKRFNLYPELTLGAAYRVFDGVMGALGIPTQQCWQVNRGADLAPVPSCEGMGDLAYFYTNCVFFLNGLLMGLFFLYGAYLSGSLVGGGVATAAFFYNHGEATRVQWTPPLRESFAYPFLVLQMALVTWTLRSHRAGVHHLLAIAAATTCFVLPWQFAQFALMTQTLSVFAVYALRFASACKVKVVLRGQLLGFSIAFVLLFGNEMLLTSFFLPVLLTVMAIVAMEPVLERALARPLVWLVQAAVLLTGTLGIKTLAGRLLAITDDAHIGNIFRSKFSDYKDFHTMLYTCAREFDFLELETGIVLCKTLLIPTVAVVLLAIAVHLVKDVHSHCKGTEAVADGDDEDEDAGVVRSRVSAAVLYNVVQLCAFALMAVMVMRLKLFLTPQLCLVASLIASRDLLAAVAGPRARHYAVVAALVAVMSFAGVENLRAQWAIRGEFANYPLEEMLEWIKTRTPPPAVFAGAMPTMAAVKLSTGRAIVNHPHYEDAGLRARTRLVYSLYSRRPVADVSRALRSLRVDFAVLEDSWCTRRTKPGCSMPEIWDLEDAEHRGKPPVCSLLRTNPEPHFKTAFKNRVYTVLHVLHV